MSYFYADGRDKAGNRLITSYKKEEQAKRYRAGATISEGEKHLNIREDGTASLGTEGNMLVRTLMLRPEGQSDADMNGNFVVYARTNGKWAPTEFRYSTYAKANSAVKSALINLYEGCAVIELGSVSSSPSVEDDNSI